MALKELLEQNEVRKVVQAEKRQAEKDADLRACFEYSKVLQQQEMERGLYFKARNGKSSDQSNYEIGKVLQNLVNKNKEEEVEMRKFEIDMLSR